MPLLLIIYSDSLQLRCITTDVYDVFKRLDELHPSYIQNIFHNKETVYNHRDESILELPNFKRLYMVAKHSHIMDHSYETHYQMSYRGIQLIDVH